MAGILLLRRQAMQATQQAPFDARVDYLETNGTQWIDTLHVPIVGDSFDIEVYHFQLSSNPQQQTVLSAGNGTNQLVCPWNRSSNLLYFRYFSSSGSSGVNCPGNRWRKISADSSGNLYLDGTLVDTVQPAGDIDGTNKTLRLLYRANNTNPLYGRIRSFKLMSGNTPVLDLIPVRIGQVGYMYDRVSGQLFGNAGTGDFILGPDV